MKDEKFVFILSQDEVIALAGMIAQQLATMKLECEHADAVLKQKEILHAFWKKLLDSIDGLSKKNDTDVVK